MKCPKCGRKKYVTRSTQAGHRLCRKCEIKWRMSKPNIYRPVEIIKPSVPGRVS